jgi:hypothetical protein
MGHLQGTLSVGVVLHSTLSSDGDRNCAGAQGVSRCFDAASLRHPHNAPEGRLKALQHNEISETEDSVDEWEQEQDGDQMDVRCSRAPRGFPRRAL